MVTPRLLRPARITRAEVRQPQEIANLESRIQRTETCIATMVDAEIAGEIPPSVAWRMGIKSLCDRKAYLRDELDKALAARAQEKEGG